MTVREWIFNLLILSGVILVSAAGYGVGWKTGCFATGVAILGTCWQVLKGRRD